jgi:hypothetical protein
VGRRAHALAERPDSKYFISGSTAGVLNPPSAPGSGIRLLPVSVTLPSLFIGSSSEGLDYARHLQAELANDCDASIWNQGVFGLSGNTLTSLVQEADRVDFAVLVLTPDDLTSKRGNETHSIRDNVLFEAGLFIGALGAPRTILMHANDLDLDLPSDLMGTTTCTFRSQRSDNRIRAAVGPAATDIREVLRRLGLKDRANPGDAEAVPAPSNLPLTDERDELNRELDVLTNALSAHGWNVKTRSISTFRVVDRQGNIYPLPLGDPRDTRERLRPFAQQISEAGVRISQTLLHSLPR